jgi:hypothetical protein
VHAEARKPEFHNFLPRAPLDLEEDQIFETATNYRNWTCDGFTLKDLPAFDNSATLGITLDDENNNIREEIKKILEFVNSRKPPLFDSLGALSGVNVAGFDDLFNIIDQIRCNFNIIKHDNACLVLDHYLQESVYDAFIDSRWTLRTRHLKKPSGTTESNPKLLSDENKNKQAYHTLIDFIFQSLAWWLIHVAERKSTHAMVVAILARWSVKLKLISLDPVRWAEHALLRGEDVMRKVSHEQKDEDRMTIRLPANDPEAESKIVNFPNDQDLDHIYYFTNFHIRVALFRLVEKILGNLTTGRLNSVSSAIEVRTLIYSSDLDGLLHQVTVHRNMAVEISSNLTYLRHSYVAFQLLLANTRGIPQTDIGVSSSEIAKIDWHVQMAKSDKPDTGSIKIERLDDVISALVPLGLMGGSKLVTVLDGHANADDFNDDYIPVKLELSLDDSPKIEFSLSTRQNRNDDLRRLRMNMVPTSRSPLITSMEGKQNSVYATL